MGKQQLHRKCNLLILGGILLAGAAHGDATPNLWGPKVVSPAALHVPAEQSDITAKSFKYVALNPVLFNSGKATISHEGQKALDAAADYLLKHNNIQRILVEGNTDYIGTKGYNDRLSDRRSEMVRNYLTLKGVDPNLIVLSGKGETDPVDQNWTRDGRSRNRHVAIYAVQWQRHDKSDKAPISSEPTSSQNGADSLDWQQSSFGR